ncbi:GntR family transcriptional regulator [Bowmanella dokdonensis]|uniref:GntR family transcriptional regulator n=1 Tax=Bowmanella dokdonensis TaxID=751969 RepID=A0A939IS10_9ALTE|nr:GntR family transcriptional regulator [Bowmanella dokdonensis]MBN7826217.1 GntR family transcriptional regulator [Bowmanella dokdonensis]
MTLYQRLKQDLQQGRFNPGEVLKQRELAEQYGVSRIPVRDAVQKLKSEGWLVTHGKCGIAVPGFDPIEVEDIYLMRKHLEPLLQNLALQHLNSEILGRARDILSSMDERSDLTAAEIGQHNWAFHACLYRAARRPTLFAMVEHLHLQCQRYIGYQSLSLNYQDRSQQEHHALLDALQQGQGERAAQLLQAHIVEAGEGLVSFLRQA